MNVLVTGSRGFLGRHVVDVLVRRGHSVADLYYGESDARVDLENPIEVKDYLSAMRPDLVLHLAGLTSRQRDSIACYSTNVLGTVYLMEAAGAASVPRVVSVGSAAEYGPQSDAHPVNEDAACHPASPHGCSKLLQTHAVRTIADRFGMRWCVVRAFNLFGRGQPDGTVVADTIRRLNDDGDPGRVFRIRRARDVRDFVPVRVVAEMLAAVVDHPNAQGIYNACSGRGVSIGAVTRWLADELHWEGTLDDDNQSAQRDQPTYSVGDPARLEVLLGRRWEFDIEDEIRQMVRK